ncbi:hypothetical protein BDV97DRAFT_397079 [Delphinella strobiligena]|nr:hypothetical protein BDV97DRAFT_397079 [Delphinella strobiligena]
MSHSQENNGTGPPNQKQNLPTITTTPTSAYSASSITTSSPESWHNEASSALYDGPTPDDPSVHHPAPNSKPRRRASCPYDGTCTHEIETDDKACSCGKVTRDEVRPHHNHHHFEHRKHAHHDRAHPEQSQRQQRGDGLGIARRDSYDDYKRGWYRGWLGDGSEEQAQPWGFSSTHASRGTSPVPESKFESLH